MGRVKEAFRNDMNVTSELYRSLASNRLCLVREPVIQCETLSVAYHELLMRARGETGLESCGMKIEAVERVGLTRMLDRAVINAAISALQADEALHLGCNLALDSFSADWWERAIEYLEGNRPVASRLILELTERQPVTQYDIFSPFFNRLHRAGVGIVLDDFGLGYWDSSILMDLQPRYIKLDRSVLHRTRSSKRSREMTQRLRELSRHWRGEGRNGRRGDRSGFAIGYVPRCPFRSGVLYSFVRM